MVTMTTIGDSGRFVPGWSSHGLVGGSQKTGIRVVEMKTATVGVREAKAYLSKYLKIVGQGGEVIITDRGVPVGKIVPIPAAENSLAQRLQKLEQEGVIGCRPARSTSERQFPLTVPSGMAQKFLQEDRDNG